MLWSTHMHAYMYACKYRMHTLMHTPFVNELLHNYYIYIIKNIICITIYYYAVFIRTSGDPHIVQNSPM